MNGFTSRKIRNTPPRKPLSEKTKQHILAVLSGIIVLAFLYYGGRSLGAYISQLKILNIFTGVVGIDPIADEKGHTNILLLGVGGEGHDGEDLTDTMIVASLDNKGRTVSMLSIPRDLHINSSIGEFRINRLYEQGKKKWGSAEGLDFARINMQKIVGVPLQYAAKIDFDAFVNIVDSVGGIDIYVDEDIYDTGYPLDGTYDFETFSIQKGERHLDGKTALKYVRSRKTSSDFDRSKRQHKALVALKEKAGSRGLLGKGSFIKELYYSLSNHVETTFSVRELIGLANFAKDWDSANLETAVLSDEPTFRGGFLYTPLRELYGGAYVLLPAGDTFDSVHDFAELVLYGPENISASPLAVLNATKKSGIAGKVSGILNRYGFRISNVGNARVKDAPMSRRGSNGLAKPPRRNIGAASSPELEPPLGIKDNAANTEWYVADPEAEKFMPYLQKLLPGSVNSQIPQEYLDNPKLAGVKIILEIGQDSLPLIQKLDIFRNVVELVAPKSVLTPETSAGGDASGTAKVLAPETAPPPISATQE